MKKAVLSVLVAVILVSAHAEQLSAPQGGDGFMLDLDLPEAKSSAPKVEPAPGGTEFRQPRVRPSHPVNPPVFLPPPQLPREKRPARPSPPPRPGRVETPPQFKKYERFPVWDTFYQKFKRCEPGCEPRVNNLLRPGDPRCHGVGAAIDIDGMHCKGEGSFRALNNPRFEKMVHCMKYEQKMLTLWKNGSHVTQGHHDHAHFSVGCHSGY